MHIYLYQIKCKRNEVDKYKYLDKPLKTFANAHFKYQSSLMHLEMIIHFDPADDKATEQLARTNYCFNHMLQRYYFIDDIQFLNGNMCKLILTEDVLYTYKSQILNTSVMIKRNAQKFNGMYPDEKYPVTNQKRVTIKKISGSPFSSSDMDSGKRCIMLTTNGGAI